MVGPLSLPPSLPPLQLTCAAVGLPVDCESSTCLWVCCSDGYGGQVCLLDLEQSTQPQLVANITISDSKILCITAVPTHGRKEFSLLNGPEDDLYPSSGRQSRSLARVAIRRVRSNSVPPDIERGLEETDGLLRQKRSHRRRHGRTHSPPSPTPPREAGPKRFSTKDHTGVVTKLWSPLTLRPSCGLDSGARSFEGLGDRCMWLGTEGGQVHVYGAGDNLRARSQRRTVELLAPVHCIR